MIQSSIAPQSVKIYRAAAKNAESEWPQQTASLIRLRGNGKWDHFFMAKWLGSCQSGPFVVRTGVCHNAYSTTLIELDLRANLG
jgi:hypothetical protein